MSIKNFNQQLQQAQLEKNQSGSFKNLIGVQQREKKSTSELRIESDRFDFNQPYNQDQPQQQKAFEKQTLRNRAISSRRNRNNSSLSQNMQYLQALDKFSKQQLITKSQRQITQNLEHHQKHEIFNKSYFESSQKLTRTKHDFNIIIDNEEGNQESRYEGRKRLQSANINTYNQNYKNHLEQSQHVNNNIDMRTSKTGSFYDGPYTQMRSTFAKNAKHIRKNSKIQHSLLQNNQGQHKISIKNQVPQEFYSVSLVDHRFNIDNSYLRKEFKYPYNHHNTTSMLSATETLNLSNNNVSNSNINSYRSISKRTVKSPNISQGGFKGEKNQQISNREPYSNSIRKQYLKKQLSQNNDSSLSNSTSQIDSHRNNSLFSFRINHHNKLHQTSNQDLSLQQSQFVRYDPSSCLNIKIVEMHSPNTNENNLNKNSKKNMLMLKLDLSKNMKHAHTFYDDETHSNLQKQSQDVNSFNQGRMEQQQLISNIIPQNTLIQSFTESPEKNILDQVYFDKNFESPLKQNTLDLL
eukprot:403372310